LLRTFSGLKPIRLGPLGLVRPDLLAVGAMALAAVLAGVSVALFLTAAPPAPSAHLVAGKLKYVPLDQPVTLAFSRGVDLRLTKVQVTPHTPFTLSHSATSLVIAPAPNWKPSSRYTIALGSVPDAKHQATLKGFHAVFNTEPLVGVAAWTVDGQPASGRVLSSPRPSVTAVFTDPMKTATVQFTLNGAFLPASDVSWNKATEATVTLQQVLVPYHDAVLGVASTGVDQRGDPMTGPAQVTLAPLALEPANTTTGIGPGFKWQTPLLIVIENSGPARPQYGLQNADMVFEYLSEYGITRMTTVFFNQVSPTLRPVRSCRMINLYLDWAFKGDHMCSGTSAGTYGWFMGNHNNPIAPGAINDVDQHGYFFRCGADDAPHNLCVSAATAQRLRQNWSQNGEQYEVDPPHPDATFGSAAPAPDVGQHCVSYTYDAASQQYLRFDHGTPFIDAGTGQQVHVKNVVVMNVNEHFAGWVEDENGGAGSVWYEMIGSGPAQIWSDGRMVNATWHLGDNLGVPVDNYWQNNEAPYFTDGNGNVIELNSGLTWVHVIGNQGLNGGC
jgi:hypothetical protein